MFFIGYSNTASKNECACYFPLVASSALVVMGALYCMDTLAFICEGGRKMSIGNDIVLCPMCDGAGGDMDCSICEGEGITFTWKVDEYNEKRKK